MAGRGRFSAVVMLLPMVMNGNAVRNRHAEDVGGRRPIATAGIGTNAMRSHFPWVTKTEPQGNQMKKILLASACIFALATPTAFAQTTQPTGGASSQGNVGPGASEGAMKDGTMNQGTTGASRPPSPRGDASTSGADTAAGTHNTGTTAG